MKNYVAPSIKVSLFQCETIDATETLAPLNPLSALATDNMKNYLDGKDNAVQKSIKMNETMQFVQ